MLMAQDPELLLVDEPVAGMTPRESGRTGELLSALARKHSLIVIDHDMNFVRQIAHRVTVLHPSSRVARIQSRWCSQHAVPPSRSEERNRTVPLGRLDILSLPQRLGDGLLHRQRLPVRPCGGLPLHAQSLTGRCEAARQGGLVGGPGLPPESIAERSRRPCESEGTSGLALPGRQARQRRQRRGYLVLLAR